MPYEIGFEWSPVPRAAGYVIQVAEAEGFGPPLLVNRTVTVPSFEAELAVAGPLWWRVAALDARGTTGPWSAVRKLEILPPPVAPSVFSVSVTPSAVAGGEAAEGLVTLVEAAPPGGATVLLVSGDPDLVELPPRVLIAAGNTSATFRLRSKPVAAETAVPVTARARIQSRATTVTVAPQRPPARLASLELHPAVLAGGTSARGTVALAGPAPSAITVRLASGDAARAAVPPSVTIPTGASVANFVIETAHDNSPGEVAVTAFLDGMAKSARLTLRGAGSMAPLAAPSPLEPAESAWTRRDLPAEFSWSEVIGAATYTIEIGASADFDTPPAMAKVLAGPRVSLGPLPAGALFWRVRANDPYGAPGRWSRPRALRVR